MPTKRLTPSPMLIPDDLEALLEAVLSRAEGPLSISAAIKALPAGKKPKKTEVQRSLGQLVTAGRIHRWPGAGEKFSAVNPQTFAREQVLQALSSAPLTEGEIKRQMPTAAKSLVTSALTALVSERTVMRHPKLGRRVPFGLGPPDAADYLPAELESAFKRLMKAGFNEAELQLALRRYTGAVEDDNTSTDGAQEILAAMPRLNSQASRGALVYVADLRAALTKQFRDKDSFDRAVLELAEKGQVQLQSHAWPGRLSDSEKNALIPNGRGSFFDAIGLRLE
jgi:hypothetical protein